MIDLWPVQQAIVAALEANPATYPVYDAVREKEPRPYLVIGDANVFSDETLESASLDADLAIHAWSRYAGKKQAWEMLAFVRARLNGASLGSGVWAITEDFVQVLEDPASREDSRLFHGIARYRIRAG